MCSVAKSAKFGAPQLNSPRVNQNPRLASSSWPFWTGSLPPVFITQESNFHSAAQQWYDHRSITKISDFSDSTLEFGTNIIRGAPGNLVLFVNYWLSQRWTFRRKYIQYICIQYIQYNYRSVQPYVQSLDLQNWQGMTISRSKPNFPPRGITWPEGMPGSSLPSSVLRQACKGEEQISEATELTFPI